VLRMADLILPLRALCSRNAAQEISLSSWDCDPTLLWSWD
jgi:hypothetical protein